MKSSIFIVAPFEVVVGQWPLASCCGSWESSHALASFLFISVLLESQNPHLWRPTEASNLQMQREARREHPEGRRLCPCHSSQSGRQLRDQVFGLLGVMWIKQPANCSYAFVAIITYVPLTTVLCTCCRLQVPLGKALARLNLCASTSPSPRPYP